MNENYNVKKKMASIRRRNNSQKALWSHSLFMGFGVALAMICITLPVFLLQIIQEGKAAPGSEASSALRAGVQGPPAPSSRSLATGQLPSMKKSHHGRKPEKIVFDNMTMEHLKNAGLEASLLSDEVLKTIPDWQKIQSILGSSSSPHILGLETCPNFRALVGNKTQRYIGVSGMFNSGTNVLARLLQDNCIIPPPEHLDSIEDAEDDDDSDDEGILWQVPWGKHSPAWQRDLRRAPDYEGYNNSHVLAAVMVRNPYEIMESMCRNSYSVHYPENVASHCPHLVHPETGQLLPVEVGLSKPRKKHKSIAHYWNDWYMGYFRDFPHPRLIIRLEDLTVYPKETIQTICECAGGTMVKEKDFKFMLSSAKKGLGHGDASEKNGLVEAWARLGREIDFPLKDYEAALEHLDHELMDAFKFNPPPLKQT